MPLLYQDAAEDRRTTQRIAAQRRRITAEHEAQHRHPPSEAELTQIIWQSKMEAESNPMLPLGALPFTRETI